MLNAAVIGVGSMGRNHARVYSEIKDVKLKAIADTDKRGKRIAEMYNCNYYPDYRKMLDNEKLDIVSIAVPTKAHKKVAADVINKQINVLIEKPLASTVEEAKELIKIAKEKNIKLSVGHIERYNPAIMELKKRLDNNELGKIFKITARRMGPFPPRVRDVGVVIDLAVHDLDIMKYLTNSEVMHVYAETEQKIHTENEDMLLGLLRFNNGVIGMLNIDWLTPTKIRKLAITGEKGMFVADYLRQELYFYENSYINGNFSYSDVIMGITEGNMIKIKINKKEPLKVELESFVQSVKDKKEPLVNGDDALYVLILANKLIESREKGQVVLV